ncbi:MAG: HlyC/CorC family transporter [Spirochaetaceae bacterium]|nr:HlyC/CorC family transporter [Spirochaetaceae bacterium]
MPDGSVQLLVALIILILFSGFFSATETAFSCANKIKLRTLASNGNKRATKVLVLAEENFDMLISTILVGNNIVNISAATISTLLFALLIKNPKIDSSFVSTAVTTVVVLIFGEITPKFIAKTYPEKLAMLFYPIIRFFTYIFKPINIIFSGWKKFISVVFKLKNEEIITEEEIITIVEEAKEDGTLKQEETELIKSVIEFDDQEVENIYTPRVNLVAVDINSSMEDIQKVFQTTKFSRLPVYLETIDQIIGTIHQSDFYSLLFTKATSVKSILKEPYFTTSHTKISKLLNQLQKNKTHMAIVLDEYGGTLGIVTMEDILEELVGEIWDEHDVEIAHYFKEDDTTYIVNGNAPTDIIFELFNHEDEKDNFEANTVSGWILEYLGEIPISGTTFKFKNLQIDILQSTVKKINKVRISLLEENE